MHHVRLYAPSKTATQSGKKQPKVWVIEIVDHASKFIDPVMGWTGTTDTHHQVALSFDTVEDAMRYCKEHHLTPTVIEGHPPHIDPKSYDDNFTKGFRH